MRIRQIFRRTALLVAAAVLFLLSCAHASGEWLSFTAGNAPEEQAVIDQLRPVGVVAYGGHQPNPIPQQAQVVGDIPPHTARRTTDRPGIGIPVNQRTKGCPADIHIHGAENRDP